MFSLARFLDKLFAITCNMTLGEWQAHTHTDLIGDVQSELGRLRKLTRMQELLTMTLPISWQSVAPKDAPQPQLRLM